MEEAVKDGAPQLHEDAPNNTAFEWEVGGGDMDEAIQQSEVVVSQRIVNQRLVPNAMEARGVLADHNPGTNQLTVWTSTQIPHLVRLLMALVTGHPEHLIRIIAPDVGGGFGSKLYLYAEELITAIVAKQVGRPVKWIEQRTEAYIATTHGRDHLSDVVITGNRDGTITGLKTTTYANMGAYLSTFAPLIPTYLYGLMFVGCYSFPNVQCKVIAPFTNTTPVDAYRGAGRPEATYLIERMVDMFAAEVGMDPADVRRKNFIPPFDDGYEVPTGVAYDSGNYEAGLDRALEIVGYDDFRKEQAQAREEGRYLGLGFASYVEICGGAPSAIATTLGARAGLWESALVRVHPHREGHRVHRLVDARPGPRDDLRPAGGVRVGGPRRRRRGYPRGYPTGPVRPRHVRQPERSRRRRRHTHEHVEDQGQGQEAGRPSARGRRGGHCLRGRQALRPGRPGGGQDHSGHRSGRPRLRPGPA